MPTADSLDKSLILGKIEHRRRRGCQKMRWLDGITDAMDMNLSKSQEMVRDREAWHAAVHGASKSRTQLGDWTAYIYIFFLYLAPPSTMVFYLRILKKFGVWNIWVQISVPLSWMKLSKFLTFCCTSIVSTVKWEWSLLTEDTRESSVQRQWGWTSSSFTLHFVICSQRTQNPRNLKTRQFVNFELKEEKGSPRAREREIPCRPFRGCSLSLFERSKYWPQCFPDCKTKASMYINACVCAKSLQPCSTLCNPTSCSLQATLPMGFSRKEYWLLRPPPRDLPNPGI